MNKLTCLFIGLGMNIMVFLMCLITGHFGGALFEMIVLIMLYIIWRAIQ